MSQIALEYRDVFVVAKYDVNDNSKKIEEYHIRGTPTYILFYEGNIVKVIIGTMSKERLVNRILEGLATVIKPPLTQEQTDGE